MTSGKRILLIWDADYPWDIRVEKVGNALADAKYEVHVLARNLARRDRQSIEGRLTVHRLPALPRWMGRLNDGYSFPAFINPVWILACRRLVRQLRPEAILVRDLPLAPVGLAAGRWSGIPVLLDMAESYPEMIRNVWLFGPRKVRNLFLRNPLFADLVEKSVVSRVDHTFAVVEEARNRLIGKGVRPERITIVSNTPDPSRFLVPAEPESIDGHLRLLYVGLIGRSRGLDIAIRGLAEVIRRGQPTRLQVIGVGGAAPELKQLAQTLGVADHVDFAGWLDNTKVPAAIREADVGIIPHRSCPHWETTIPNKLFDYMAASKPVLVSDVAPAKRIVQETGAGLIHGESDPESFADAVQRFRSPELRSTSGRAGRRAVEQRYNWATDAARLVEVVRRVTTEPFDSAPAA
jgi:glycosyltransferase involved in cell wall biosynthesis